MAPNIGDSIKNAVDSAKDAVEDAVDKVTGHSHDEAEATEATAETPSAEPTPMVVETEAISEPLEFERDDTQGNSRSLTFEPVDEAPGASHPTATE
jgi:hypothetical protein